MSVYSDKMQKLREGVPQGGMTYRVSASHMKDPATGDPYALIETEYDYGVPGGARGFRKIQIGDELPEGSVTDITTEGITVIPPVEGDEFVLPIDYGTPPPPGKKTPKEEKPPYEAGAEHVSALSSIFAQIDSLQNALTDPELSPEERDYLAADRNYWQAMQKATQSGFEKAEPTYWYDEDTDTLEPYERYNRERAQKERREKIRGGLGGNDLALDAFQPFDAFRLKSIPRPPDPFLTEEEERMEDPEKRKREIREAAESL